MSSGACTRQRPPQVVTATSPFERLIVRPDTDRSGKPLTLFVLEIDREIGEPGASLAHLKAGIAAALRAAASLPQRTRVFTSTLVDGERNFIAWTFTASGNLRASRKPNLLPYALVGAELRNESLDPLCTCEPEGRPQ